jgi:hypothetical protein
MATRKDLGKIGMAKKAFTKGPASGALPPYGTPIREAMARGDVQEMRKVADAARKWVKDVQTALEKLEQKIEKLSGY